MKAISMSEPFATLLATGEKKFETRGWKPVFKDDFQLPFELAVHASKRILPAYLPLLKNKRFIRALRSTSFVNLPEDFSLGAIIGVVKVRRILPSYEVARMLKGTDEILFGDYRPNRWAWETVEPRLLDTPVPCKGAFSLWNVPADVEAKIREQL